MFLQVLIMASAFPCFSLIQHGGKPAEKQIGHFRNISCSQCVASAFRCPDPSRKVTRFSPQNFHIFGSNIHRQYAFPKSPSFALAKIGGKPAEKQIGHLRNTSYPQCVASVFCCPDPFRKVTRFSTVFFRNILHIYCKSKIKCTFALYTWKQQDNKDRKIIIKKL
jgi:hypothetical protein